MGRKANNYSDYRITKGAFFDLIALLVFCLVLSIFVKGQSKASEDDILAKEELAKETKKEWNSESYRRSVLLYNEASDNWLTLNRPEKAIESWQEAAKLQLKLGFNDSALSLLSKALALAEKERLAPQQSETKSLISGVYLKTGNKKQCELFFQQAMRLSESVDNPRSTAMAYYAAAEYYYGANQFEQSLEYYQKAYDLWSPIGDLREQGNILIYSSYAHMVLGQAYQGFDKAKEAEKKFLELNDLRGLALSRIAIGHLLSAINKKQLASDYYSRARENFPDDIDLAEKGALLNGLGFIYENFGDFKLSFSFRKQALECFKRDRFLYGELATMHSLINLSHILAEHEEAKKYLREAENLSLQLNDKYFLSLIYRQIGDHHFSQKDLTGSKPFYEKSLSASRLFGYKENDSIVLDRLGKIAYLNKDFAAARQNFSKSLEISRKIVNRFGEAETLYNLSKLEVAQGNLKESAENAAESCQISEALYSDLSNSKLTKSYFANIYNRYELYINLLMKMHEKNPDHGYALKALQASERSRSRSLLETLRLSEANFIKDADPELVKKESELRNLLNIKADKLTDLLSQNAPKEESDKLSDEIHSFENDLENIKAELKQKSPVYSSIKNPPPFDIGEFQQNILDDNTLLLEYAFGEKESYLWLVGKNEVLNFILPAREIIESRITKIKESLDSRQILESESPEDYQKRIADMEALFKQESSALSNELLGVAAEKIRGKKLIIVPDGKLALLPISTLPFPNSDSPLILSNEVIYEPSASLLNIMAKIERQEKAPGKDMLIFADPVFSDNDVRIAANLENKDEKPIPTILGLNLRDFRIADGNGKIPRLIATENEANSIADEIGKSRATIASGFAASRERAINSDISDYKILHFATHGLIDIERPEVSSIVLSLFNENGEKREGYLRLQDIYGLNLSADLVVLSACQSGIGKEIKGEGMMSLNNGFLQAGARSVLSSAWKVDDDATAELMKNFYAGLIGKGLPPAEALRQAQIKMLSSPQFSSPFYWGAFTLQGEFRNQIKVSPDYRYHLIFGILGIIALIMLWKFKISKSR